jgi:hypothetical protein
MAKLFWLKTIQPCKLELRPLTDYAGQPLIFTTPGTGFSRRCVTEEVRNSAAVQTYITRQMIADESPVATPPVPVAVSAAPPARPIPVAIPVVLPPAPEPTPVLTSDPTPVPADAATVIPEAPVETPEATESSEPEATSEAPRNKRNRGRY